MAHQTDQSRKVLDPDGPSLGASASTQKALVQAGG